MGDKEPGPSDPGPSVTKEDATVVLPPTTDGPSAKEETTQENNVEEQKQRLRSTKENKENKTPRGKKTEPENQYISQGTREKEVEYAEIELRLRRMIMELLQPSVKKTKELDYLVTDLRHSARDFDKRVSEIAVEQTLTRNRMEYLDAIPEMFITEVARRRQGEQNFTDSLLSLRNEVEALQRNSGEKGNELASVQTDILRQSQELKEKNAAHFKDIERRMNESASKQKDSLRELENRVAEQEVDCSNLRLQVYGDNGLQQELQHDQRVIAAEMEALQKNITIVTTQATKCVDLEESISQLRSEGEQVTKDLEQLLVDSSSKFNELKDDITKNSNQIAAHTAMFMQRQRKEYQAELGEVKRLRDEVERCLQTLKTDTITSKEHLDAIHKRNDEALRLNRLDIDRLMEEREPFRCLLQERFDESSKKSQKAIECSQNLAYATTHITTIIKVLLESIKISYKMDDDVHRIMMVTMEDDQNEAQLDTVKMLRWSLIDQASSALQNGPKLEQFNRSQQMSPTKGSHFISKDAMPPINEKHSLKPHPPNTSISSLGSLGTSNSNFTRKFTPVAKVTARIPARMQ